MSSTTLSVRLVYRCDMYAQRNHYCFSKTFLCKSLTWEWLKKIKQESNQCLACDFGRNTYNIHIYLVSIYVSFFFFFLSGIAIKILLRTTMTCLIGESPQKKLNYSCFRGFDCQVSPSLWHSIFTIFLAFSFRNNSSECHWHLFLFVIFFWERQFIISNRSIHCTLLVIYSNIT